MRSSLNQQSVPTARQLDDELTLSMNAAAVVQIKIREVNLEVLQLAYDIFSFVGLHVLYPHERTDDPLEGHVAIYELSMQQALRLSFHPFFHEVLMDFNLAPCQITPRAKWWQCSCYGE
ncbi:hypothetical protein Adt_47461 [Abeliophyllum distichum]|uniref:Uncharacterized protein n=1 Tax=Abeliophyllum distichum TaxID=126358 RepID=A0ABD1NWS9_9LAMI